MSLVTREEILAILEKGGGIRSIPPLIHAGYTVNAPLFHIEEMLAGYKKTTVWTYSQTFREAACGAKTRKWLSWNTCCVVAATVLTSSSICRSGQITLKERWS